MRAGLSVPHRFVATLRAMALLAIVSLPAAAQTMTGDSRDPKQSQDSLFARLYREWTPAEKYGSPLVDHLPLVKGIPTPREVIGYYVGAPRKLTYYADQLKYYRALAAATPRVKVETIGKSDEGRELVVVWVSSDENMKKLQTNRDNLGRIADPRGLSDAQISALIKSTKPHYHLMGGLHSGETGPSEMLMELVYRIATENSPIISQIRNNVYVSITPVADADGRDRNVDWFYKGLEPAPSVAGDTSGGRGGAGGGAGAGGGGGRGGGIGSLPYWGKYTFHDNNRDINLSLIQMRAIGDWYFTAHPPIMHDLHEAQPLMYIYSGGPPQNPNLDPLLFAELPWFSNFEMAQMTKFGMPGVYDHSFMDGWSPGYLGSIAYNHNGMMKMYETTSGRDIAPVDSAAAGGGRGAGGGNAGGRGAGGGGGNGGGRGAGGGGRAGGAGRGGVAGADSAAATAGRGALATPPGGARGGPGGGAPGGGRAGAVPTGRGGSQDREWFRGIPIGPTDAANFTRRVNTNYMETGVLSALQLTSMFPQTIVENFYIKTRNSINEGKTKAPYGFVIPVQRDMTKAAELINVLRIQGIEVGIASAPVTLGGKTYPAGSYIIKRDQPYGRLAKNLLEKQVFPDPRLSTYDDSGWSMGLAMNVDVVEVADSAILKTPTTAVGKSVVLKGTTAGAGSAGIAVAHYGSNNMISFRYRLKNVAMKITEKSFTVDSMEFPAGSFIIADPASAAAVRSAVQEFGLSARALDATPMVAMHDADVPRIAIYSSWGNTQNLGWYRLTFDRLAIPFDLIYKEQVKNGTLAGKYDVILMAEQGISKNSVLAAPAARPQPYQKSDKYQFLGMYGSTADMSGGFGQEGVDEFARFLSGGGTLIAISDAMRFPIDFGWARTIETQNVPGVTSSVPLVQGQILKPLDPVFYGYEKTTFALKYGDGPSLRAGLSDQGNLLSQYVGGDASVLSGLMVGADSLRGRAFAADIAGAINGKGRVFLFANNPIYRWQNLGEFNMVFNSILNWNDVVKP